MDVISPIPGWTWELRASGILLRSESEPHISEIRYRERRHPVAPVAALIAAEAPPGWRETERDATLPFITDEGEYAALVTVRGVLEGLHAVRALGFVFLDDHVACIAGLGPVDDEARLQATVRALTRRDCHLAGVRRRRYVFAPPDPARWHGYLLPPFHAHYLPLAYPNDATTITVLPAVPASSDQVLAVVLASRRGLPVPIAGDGVSGEWITVIDDGDPAQAHDVVVHGDDRYTYPLIMRSTGARRAAHLKTFLAVARSIKPLPRPSVFRVGGVALDHWTD